MKKGDKNRHSNKNSNNTEKSKILETEKIKNELTKEQKKEIKDAFSTFEEDGILPEEIKAAMNTLGFDVNNPEVMKILDKIDTKNGPLKFDDFMDVMIEKNEEKDPQLEIKKAFKVLCEEGTDKITMKSLNKICSDLGEKIDENELQEMISEISKEQEDEVNENDFIKMMQKTGMV